MEQAIAAALPARAGEARRFIRSFIHAGRQADTQAWMEGCPDPRPWPRLIEADRPGWAACSGGRL